MSTKPSAAGSRRLGKRLSLTRIVVSLVSTAAIIAVSGWAIITPYLPATTPGAAMDARWFASYYDVTLETGDDLAWSSYGESAGGAVLAFVVAADASTCTPTWGTAYTLDSAADSLELDRRIARMQQAGRPVAISFGGAVNTELATACTDASSLTNAYAEVLDRYHTDVMDIDIEGDELTDTAANARRASAVAALQAERDAEGGNPLQVWLTLPVSPTGLTEDGLAIVTQMLAQGVQISGINAMTMNYGITDSTPDMSDVSISALTALSEQLEQEWSDAELDLPSGGVWALIGATPMIGRNDVETEVFSTEDATALNAFATEKGMARLSMWSLNRDETCGTNYPYVGVVSNECSGVDQGGESFATLLATGYDGSPGGQHADPASATAIADDAATSPYPIWSSAEFYSAGVEVVWNGSVYMAKWWNEDGSEPDDPTLATSTSAWTYIGPVLATDTPFSLPQLAEGTYPEWSADQFYNQGDRVMYNGTGYEAKWWSQGQEPDGAVLDHDYSAWRMLDEGE